MTPPTSHDELRERAAAYALGALSVDERVEFEAHLAVCVECATEVRAFAPAVSALAHAATPLDPPRAVRDRMLARLSGQVSPLPETGTRDASSSRLLTRTRTPRTAFTPAPWLLAAASLALALGLGAYSVRQRSQIVALEQSVRGQLSRAEAAERELASARAAAGDARTVVVVLAASDLVRVDLAGQPVAPRASARAFWSRSQGLVFTASNLPPLPPGRTYQLWIVTAGMPVGAGLLRPRVDGGVNVVYMTPSDVAKAVALAVTIEPEGGVPAPTGDKYLVGLVN